MAGNIMGELLRLDGVGRTFGAVVAAESLCLEVGEGEALGIVGPNGAGKTTMFNLITGELRPNQGRVFFAGADISAMPPAARARIGIGRTYQIPHPFAGMTVFENVLVGAAFGGGLSERAAYGRAAEILETTELFGKANRLAGSLTLLDRKRLELARALATGPRLLLLDEIAGGLTEPETLRLVETILALRATGVAVVWIEHIVHALTKVVDRLLVLNFGRVLCEGDPTEVMSSPEVREVYLGIGVA